MKSSPASLKTALPLLLLVGGFLHTTPAAAAPKPATLQAGSIMVKHKNAKTTTTLRSTGQLEEGDVVATATGAKASLTFADGTKIEMQPESAIEIPKAGDKANAGMLLRVLNGRIGAHLTPNKTIATRTSLIRVKGTKIVITVAPDGTTTLEVLEGAAEISNPCGQALVNAGMKSEVRPSTAPGLPFAVPDMQALLKEWEALQAATAPPAAP